MNNPQTQKLPAGTVYVGVHDRNIDLFESQYSVPEGMSYNSYVILDEKIAVMDTVDRHFTGEWLENLKNSLGGRQPNYLIVQHMEPDHSAGIADFMSAYPNAVIVGNTKTFAMIKQFFGEDSPERQLIVADGAELTLGKRVLKFIFAPMVHWPEVMMTYEPLSGTLFSADAFGRFGTADAEIDWLPEARRYYFGIVGKYGAQVQALLKKASTLEIKSILPLHGPILSENVGKYIEIYDKWSSYTAESSGVCIAYTSVYGNTEKAVLKLKNLLTAKGVEVVTHDLARCDFSLAVADAFRFENLVLATTTYNAGVFPPMREFIFDLTERGFKNRRVGFIENGTWAPTSAKTMANMLESAKGISYCETTVHIKSALNEISESELNSLSEELCRDPKHA